MKPALPLAAALLATAVAPALAQGEGKAPLQLGHVEFANSCDAAVQATFERGVALLHSFWWEEGRKTFREVLERDPGCAIAAWGTAAILIGNPFSTGPSPDAAKVAVAALAEGRAIGAKSERERAYIEAIGAYYEQFAERPHRARLAALAKAFGEVARRYPEDDEAQIFHALYLTSTQSPSDKSFAAALEAAGVLETEFAKHPDHPGVAHYLIHSYDYPAIADKGVAAALCYADIAPSAPHALHMPSHIFTRVGAWQQSIATNRRSIAAADAATEAAEQNHARDYLVYAGLQLAHDGEVREIIQDAFKSGAQKSPALAGSYALAAMPARYAVERNQWPEARALEPAPSRFPYTTAITHFARALGAARTGDPDAAMKDVAELQRIVDELKAKDPYWATEVEVERLAGAAWVAFARAERPEALRLARQAADLEDSSEKAAVTPGRLVPARELLADMLSEAGEPAAALAEYEASGLRDPKRFRNFAGAAHAAAAAGNRDKARYYYGRLVELAQGGDPRPELGQAKTYLAAN